LGEILVSIPLIIALWFFSNLHAGSGKNALTRAFFEIRESNDLSKSHRADGLDCRGPDGRPFSTPRRAGSPLSRHSQEKARDFLGNHQEWRRRKHQFALTLCSDHFKIK
jgi:hypothetical protein